MNDAQSNDLALFNLRSKFAGIAQDVTLSQRDWRALMESGALATLAISRYRGQRQLTAQDLGISDDDYKSVSGIVSLGHRLILPKEVLGKFNSLETRARQVLRQYTLSTPMGYFLPIGAYDSCALAMGDARIKFDQLVSDTSYELSNYRELMTTEYYNLADQVYKKLADSGVLSWSDKYTFRDNFMDRCLSDFPDRFTFEDCHKFDLRLAFVPAPYQSTQTIAPAYASATDDLMRLRQQILVDNARTQQTEVAEFIGAIQSELYTLVNDALGNVLASVKTSGQLQGRSSVQLKNLIETISTLNFWQDGKLDAIRDEIWTILQRPAQKRDIGLDRAVLTELQNVTALQLLAIGKGQRNLEVTAPAPAVALPAQRDQPLALTGVKALSPMTDSDIIASLQDASASASRELSPETQTILNKLAGVAVVSIPAPARTAGQRASKLF